MNASDHFLRVKNRNLSQEEPGDMFSIIVILVGNGIGDPNSNSEQSCLLFISH